MWYKFYCFWHIYSEAAAGGVLWKKVFLKVFLFTIFTGKLPCWGLSFCWRLQHRCFPVNIAKFLRTAILKNICERLLASLWHYWHKLYFNICDRITHYKLSTAYSKMIVKILRNLCGSIFHWIVRPRTASEVKGFHVFITLCNANVSWRILL